MKKRFVVLSLGTLMAVGMLIDTASALEKREVKRPTPSGSTRGPVGGPNRAPISGSRGGIPPGVMMDDSQYFSGSGPGGPSSIPGGITGGPGGGGSTSPYGRGPRQPKYDRTPSKPTPPPRSPAVARPPSQQANRSTQSRGQGANVGIIRGQQSAPGQNADAQMEPGVPVLYFEPVDAHLIKGVPFDVDLVLSNSSDQEFDTFNVVAQYDPSCLAIQDLDSETEGLQWNKGLEDLKGRLPWIAKSPDLYKETLDETKGLIEFGFSTPEGKPEKIRGVVGRFRFVSIADSGRTSITLLTSGLEKERKYTCLSKSGKDVLGTPEDPNDGVLSAVFRLSSAGQTDDKDAVTVGDFKTRIRFDPPEASLTLGDQFDVDILLENPREVPFDGITLVLRYNKQKLRVVDNDQNNWIKAGINLNDGNYGSSFPFTVRDRNIVSPNDGVILYRSRSPEDPIRKEGVLATVRFVAIGSTGDDGTAIQVGFHPISNDLNSGLYCRGRDVLGYSDDPIDGFGGFRCYVERRQVAELK